MSDEKDKLEVNGKPIRVKRIKGQEMFSLNDMANNFGKGKAGSKMYSWFKNTNTLDFLEAYEEVYNPNVKKRKLKKFIEEAKKNENAYNLGDFEEATNSPFVSARSAQKWAIFEISLKFMSWISSRFEVFFIKDYKKLKLQERQNLLKQERWRVQRNADNMMESLRLEQDRLNEIDQEASINRKKLN